MDADRQEAESIKYNVARIVRLSSGRFALFAHCTSEGIDLVGIGTIAELESLIPSADECRPAPTNTRSAPITSIDLDELGL